MKTPSLLVLLFFAVQIWATDQKIASQNSPSAVAGSQLALSKKELIENYSKLEKDVPAIDKPLYRKLIQKIKKMDSSAPSLKALFHAQVDFLRGLQSNHRKDLEMQVNCLKNLYFTGTTMEAQKGMEKEAARLKKQVKDETKGFLKKHPNHAGLKELVGMMENPK